MKMIVVFSALTAVNVVSHAVAARPMSAAEAHCVITGATGYGKSGRSVADAMEKAVAACIGKGGVPACCRKGARPL